MIEVLLLLLTAPAQAAIEPAEAIVEREVAVMGSRLHLEVQAESRAEALAASERAIRAVHAAEDRLSTWKLDSELAQVNRAPVGSEVALSQALQRDLDGAFACSRATEGTFDPAIGPLISAWDLRGHGKVPSRSELRKALHESSRSHFDLKLEGKLVRRSPGARVEEGGFGKGVALDDAARALREFKVASARLNFGGQILFLGKREEEIAIANPEKRDEILLTLQASEGSISTSGNSEHGLRVGQRSIGHILDPRTGHPAHFKGSVTVVAPTGSEADCLSTGLFVMGPSKGLAWLRKGSDPQLQAIFVSRDSGRNWLAQASCGLRGRVKASTPSVQLRFDCSAQ